MEQAKERNTDKHDESKMGYNNCIKAVLLIFLTTVISSAARDLVLD